MLTKRAIAALIAIGVAACVGGVECAAAQDSGLHQNLRHSPLFDAQPAPNGQNQSVNPGVPPGRRTHAFFDRQNNFLTGLEAAALLADGITTQKALHRYPEAHEADPIARVFVSHGWPGQIAGGLLVITADVAIRYALHRKGHHRIERFLPLVLITYGTFGAIHNARLLGRGGSYP